MLGSRYSRGTGVVEDYSEAVMWFRAFAEQHFPAAVDNLRIHVPECERILRARCGPATTAQRTGKRGTGRPEVLPNIAVLETLAAKAAD